MALSVSLSIFSVLCISYKVCSQHIISIIIVVVVVVVVIIIVVVVIITTTIIVITMFLYRGFKKQMRWITFFSYLFCKQKLSNCASL